MHASTLRQARAGRRSAGHRAITLLPVAILLAFATGYSAGPAPVRAAGEKLEIAVTIASKDGGWYLGGGPVRIAASVDLAAGSISAGGTGSSNDGWGTTTETLTLKGTLDPASGDMIATITSVYSYVIDADNTWTKEYSGTFKAKRIRFDAWLGGGTFAFGHVKRIGSVGNEVPAAGMSYDGTVQITIASGSLDFSPPETIEALVTSVGGDVDYSVDGGKNFKPLTRGTILPAGAIVRTGFESSAQLDFGYGTLRVPQTVGLTLDEFTSSANLRRTQLHLNVGAIEARVRHTDTIRSDFSVSTPTANASIRGSAMIVSVDAETGATTVWVTEDAAFVQGTADAAEIEVAAGLKVVVDASGHVGQPVAFEESELPGLPAPVATDTPAAAAPAGNATPGDASDAGTAGGALPIGLLAGAGVVVLILGGILLSVGRRREQRAPRAN